MGLVNYLAWLIAGTATGYFSHGHIMVERLALTALLPLVWSVCKQRSSLSLFTFSYYALASRGILAGGAVFFGPNTSFVFSGLLWLLTSLALTLPWVVLWESKYNCFYRTFLRLMLIFVIISIPPVGLFGWASPLLAVGVLFPGSRWLGLLAFLVLISLLKFAGMKKYGNLYYYTAVAVIILVALIQQPKASAVAGITGIDTHYGKVASGSARFTDAFMRTSDIAARTLAIDSNYVLVPETVAGIWTRATEDFWGGLANLLTQREQTLIVGTEIYDTAGKYDNCMLFLGFDGNKRYRQRVPVPVSMWRPFGGAGTANAYWFESGVVDLTDGRRAAMLICYEQFIVWPVFLSFIASPDILITTANQWWCRETSIPAIQLQSATSWARLFNVPLVSATNK